MVPYCIWDRKWVAVSCQSHSRVSCGLTRQPQAHAGASLDPCRLLTCWRAIHDRPRVTDLTPGPNVLMKGHIGHHDTRAGKSVTSLTAVAPCKWLVNKTLFKMSHLRTLWKACNIEWEGIMALQSRLSPLKSKPASARVWSWADLIWISACMTWIERKLENKSHAFSINIQFIVQILQWLPVSISIYQKKNRSQMGGCIRAWCV